MKKIANIIIALFIVVFLSSFTVSEIEHVVILRFGKVVRDINGAGLYFKVPIIDSVTRFDKRILEYDSDPKEIISQDKKNIVVDNYARWKIIDPLLFLQTVHDIRGAQIRLDDIIYSDLREEVARYTFNEIIAVSREEIMQKVTKSSNEKAKSLGIDIVDVRIKRAELPKQNEQNVYKRMETERNQQAKKYRAEGRETALRITSKADREKTILISEAYRKSQEIKGDGDATALTIYANAYKVDPEFYEFVRTLESYEKIMNEKKNTKIIMSTESKLWKMLK